METMILLHGILVLMIIAALFAMEAKSLTTSIISVGAAGMFLALGYLLLQAPEVAIIQIVIELSTLLLLVRATSDRDTTCIGEKKTFSLLIGCLGMVLVFVMVILRMTSSLPVWGLSVVDRIAQPAAALYLAGADGRHTYNAVSAVLLEHRGIDTLGMIAVLCCAALGAITLVRPTGRITGHLTNAPAADQSATTEIELNGLSRFIMRWLWLPMTALGLYLTIGGHRMPGGGITGGIIIAAGLIVSSFGRRVSGPDARTVMIYIVIAAAGSIGVCAATFFAAQLIRLRRAVAFIPDLSYAQFMDLCIAAVVSAVLYLVFIAFVSIRPVQQGPVSAIEE